jgi:HK97 family phage major capsid protein
MPTLIEVREEIAAKAKDLHDIFEQAGPDRDLSKAEALKSLADPAARAAEVKRRNDELTALGKKRDELVEQDGIAANARKEHEWANNPAGSIQHPAQAGGSGDGTAATRKPIVTPGKVFTDSAEYKAWTAGSRLNASVEMPDVYGFKATFDTGTATLTGYDRQAFVTLGVQRLTVADLLAQGRTTQPTIRYPQEDTFTNAATTVAEGGTKPEASWDTSEQDAPVRKIAVTSKVTDEMFADFPLMQDYIDNRMRYMVGLQEEAQLLNGNGTAPNIRGILQTSGIQTQAKGADAVPTAIYKAMVLVESVGFFMPDGYVTHPLDWQDVRTLQDANGNYIWGHPALPGPDRIWGLPVVVTTSIAQNTGLIGAFRLGAQVFYRQGIMVESTNSNEDDFKKNLIAIRAEQREALAVYRPKAFSTVTGI